MIRKKRREGRKKGRKEERKEREGVAASTTLIAVRRLPRCSTGAAAV